MRSPSEFAAAPTDPARGRRRSTERRLQLGGTDGNERLTDAVAGVLTFLLVLEGITVVRMQGLVGVHMFIGLVLIPPVLLKLSSTGYRFVRYYAGSGAYRRKGPPRLALRVLAPVLVATTIAVFVSGLLLLVVGHKAGTLLEFHKVSFIVWGVAFGVHFLAYVPRVARSLGRAWRDARAVAGAGTRGILVAASIGGGTALAVSLLPAIEAWRA